jgi:hypothetical protein
MQAGRNINPQYRGHTNQQRNSCINPKRHQTWLAGRCSGQGASAQSKLFCCHMLIKVVEFTATDSLLSHADEDGELSCWHIRTDGTECWGASSREHTCNKCR